MTPVRTLVLTAVALLPAVLGASSSAQHVFPARPIRLVVPFGPGGASDLTARTFIDLAPKFLGQRLVLQMRPGGGGAIASELVGRALPDGYTLLFGHTNANSLLPALEGRSRGPDALRAVCRVSVTMSMFVAAPDAPFKDLSELIAWARAHRGVLTISVPGLWSGAGLTWKLMEDELDLKLRLVSFDGGAEALVALLGGHVQASLLGLPQSMPQIRAGKLRALAWAGTTRHPAFPDVPTAAEEGYAHTVSVFKGIMAPRDTPDAVVERLAAAFRAMIEAPRVRDDIRRLGDEVQYLGPSEFGRYWAAEYEEFRKLRGLLRR